MCASVRPVFFSEKGTFDATHLDQGSRLCDHLATTLKGKPLTGNSVNSRAHWCETWHGNPERGTLRSTF